MSAHSPQPQQLELPEQPEQPGQPEQPRQPEQPPSRKIRLVVAYEGTRYCGWQIQPNVPTVQGVLERVLAEMTGHAVRLRAAGRTDAGVHAEGQIASFPTSCKIPLRGFHRGLNTLLPDDVGVLSAEEVAPEFDARRHNRGKLYRYSFWNQRSPSPRHAGFSHQVYRPLDLQAMALAGRLLLGTHDFAAFRAASCERETTVRTLFRCTVSTERPLVQVHVGGTAFLKNMVRIIAGTLLEVGQGKRDPQTLPLLLQHGDRTKAGMTAPARGLCLERVYLK